MDISVIMNKRELYNAIKAGYIYLFIYFIKMWCEYKESASNIFLEISKFPLQVSQFRHHSEVFLFHNTRSLSLWFLCVCIHTQSYGIPDHTALITTPDPHDLSPDGRK